MEEWLHPDFLFVVDYEMESREEWLKETKRLLDEDEFSILNIKLLYEDENVIMCQGEQPYPHTNLVSIPTAGTKPKGFYSFENIFMNNGSIVPKFMIGITDNFTLGMSYGISNFIGIGELKKFKSYPEVQIKYRKLDETQSIPALVIGIDTQGRGEFHEKYLP